MILNKKNNSNNQKIILGIGFLTLLTPFRSVGQFIDLTIGNEFFWWAVEFVFIFILVKYKKSITTPLIEKNLIFVKLFLLWNLICIVRGIFVADNYWEWKNLIATSFVLLLPLLAYTTTNVASIQSIVKTWFKYGLFIYLLFSPFIFGDGVGKFLIPISFLSLFFPILNWKWKIIVVFVSVFVITFDITARSNVLKFAVPFLIGILYYFRKILSFKILNFSRLLLLFVPFVLFALAVNGIFNVFKMDEYIGGEYYVKSNSKTDAFAEERLTTDTRTFLYIEVLESAVRHDYVLFGRTPARGNDSAYFGEYNKVILNTGKMERFGNEVSILNIFTWLGLMGVGLYFLIFFRATYLAINQSNNFFMKLIGLNISFRWAYGWVEDFSNFDLSNIFLWIMIGMCFSESFRKMTNQEFRLWVWGIFEKPKPLSRKKRYNPLTYNKAVTTQ